MSSWIPSFIITSHSIFSKPRPTSRFALFALTMLVTITIQAEETTIKIDKMHCGGCRSIVNKAVCDNPELKTTFKKCTVTVDEEIQVGTMILEPNNGSKLDLPTIQKTIEAAGDYKVSKISTGTPGSVTPATKSKDEKTKKK